MLEIVSRGGRTPLWGERGCVPEIICVSCWKGFEVEEPPPPSVNCPHCDFAQPGRVSDTTVGIQAMKDDDEAPAEPESDPFESMEAEIVSGAESPPEETPPEDNRWRIQTSTGLLLFFPEATLACQWADDQDDPQLLVAYGRGPLRPYGAFQEALKTTPDPVQALVSVAPSDGSEPTSDPMPMEAIVQEASAPEPQGPPAPAPPSAPATPAEAPAAADGQGAATGRPATMTSEFQFRTDSEGSPWKGRLIFLLIGLLAGAGGVYYAAWLGELPGILY